MVIVLAVSLADLTWELAPVPTDTGGLDTTLASRAQSAQSRGDTGEAGRSFSVTPAVKELFGKRAEDGQKTSAPQEPVRETRLNLTLKGVLAQRETDRKLALIARGDKEEKVYRMGDRIQGGEIIRIQSRRVILRRNGVTESLKLEVKELGRSVAASGSQAGGGGGGIRQTGKHRREVSKSTLQKKLQNLPKLLQQAKAVPHKRNSEAVGFRVVNIQSGSVFQDLGIEEGDVIRSVNGKPVRDPKQALQAYQDLKSADKFRVDLLREGQQLTLQYAVQ